jgi:hypothetical protein
MKQETGKESYTDEFSRKERMRTIWLKAGIRKLKRKVPPRFGGGGC